MFSRPQDCLSLFSLSPSLSLSLSLSLPLSLSLSLFSLLSLSLSLLTPLFLSLLIALYPSANSLAQSFASFFLFRAPKRRKGRKFARGAERPWARSSTCCCCTKQENQRERALLNASNTHRELRTIISLFRHPCTHKMRQRNAFKSPDGTATTEGGGSCIIVARTNVMGIICGVLDNIQQPWASFMVRSYHGGFFLLVFFFLFALDTSLRFE